ncbi:MAG: D-alanine--D-alanine ligase [Parahaliea sp.]
MSWDSIKSGRVVVLAGGSSAERDISLQTGAAVLAAYEALDCEVQQVDPADDNWLAQLTGAGFVFNALHGPGGEDGVMQGALTALGIPYTGSGVLGSALAMDKQRSKELWQGIGLSTGNFEILGADSDWQAVIDRLGKVFVKPACEGSSIGMAPAATAKALADAYANASRYGVTVLAERFIDGPEYTIAIVGDRALPSIHMRSDNEFYDYQAKYLSDDTRYFCPSDLGELAEKEAGELALAAFYSLGCSVWGRVDLMRDSTGRFYVLEVNTIPGMTSHSLVPMAAKVAGWSMPQLVRQISQLSWQARLVERKDG